ncbi:MAG: hypothetical protein LBC82_01250 [Oscillospiraceae bacterium]|jgi:hypothetical protein|nr:hypothetical protein [Oscillospiraceae bacterium]
MNSSINHEGVFEIYKNNILIKTIKNRVTDDYINHMALLLTGETAPNLLIKYLAVGNGTITDSNPVTLANETFRTQYTAAPVAIAVGEVRTEFVILADEAVGEITEIGIFAGDGATIAPNSGILISRIAWNYTKTGSDEHTIIRIDRIRRA